MSASPTPSAVPDDLREMAKALRDTLSFNGIGCIDVVCESDNGCGCIDAIAAALLQVRNAEREACARDCESHAMATGYSGTKPTHGRYVATDALDKEFHQGAGYAALIRARA